MFPVNPKQKTLAVFLAFLLLITLALVFGHPGSTPTPLPLTRDQNRIETQLPSPIPTLTPKLKQAVLARQLAKESLSYLDRQKRPNGFYRLYPSENKVIKVTNLWTSLARLGYYQKFSYRPDDLAQAEKDAQILIADCQNQLDTCLAVAVPIASLYQETRANVYKNFLNQLGQRLLLKSYGQEVMALATQVRELTKLYQIFKNESYLTTARQRLGQAQLISEAHQHRYQQPEDEACYLALAQAEIGLATNDSQFLNQARTFFQNQEFDRVPRQMTLIQPCVEAAFILSRNLKDQSLNNQANQLLGQIVTSQWNSEGGFFQGPDKKQVNLTDTAYMIYLLSFEPNRQYLFNQ